VQQRGYQLIEIGDLEYGYLSERWQSSLPVLLVSCRGDIEIEDFDLHGVAERYGYLIRVVAVHTFDEQARVLALKSAVIGELQAAVRAVQYDGTRFEAPSDGHQFFHMTPQGFEFTPEEEDLLQASEGHQNSFAVALRYRLVASSRIDR
jgi:hypothetical protein